MHTHDQPDPARHETGKAVDDEEERPEEEPRIYAVRRTGSGWGVSRRQFVGAAVASSLAGCSDDPKGAKPTTSTPGPVAADGSDTTIDPVAHTDDIVHVKFVPADSLLVSASDDHSLKLWSLPSGDLSKTLLGHKGPVKQIAVSHNGKYLASADLSGTARTWSLPDGNTIQTIDGVGDVDELHVTNDGQELLAKTRQGVTVWTVGTARLDRRVTAPGTAPIGAP